MIKKILMITALVAGFSGTFTIIKGLDGHYAKAAQLEEVKTDLEFVIEEQIRTKIESRMKDIQARLWTLEDRWAERFLKQTGESHDTLEELKNFMTPEARSDFRQLEKEYADLQKELKKLEDD